MTRLGRVLGWQKRASRFEIERVGSELSIVIKTSLMIIHF